MNVPVEVWKPIEGLVGYEISSWGRCRNSKGKIMHRYNNGKSIAYAFCQNGIQTFYTAKDLVADAFIPNPDNKKYVIIKNGINYEINVENILRTNKMYSMFRGKMFCTAQEAT